MLCKCMLLNQIKYIRMHFFMEACFRLGIKHKQVL